jgi:hypothetical protein
MKIGHGETKKLEKEEKSFLASSQELNQAFYKERSSEINNELSKRP